MEQGLEKKDEERRLLQRGAGSFHCALPVGYISVFLPDSADTASFKGSQDELTSTIIPIREEDQKQYALATFLPCDPRRWMHRFLMLALMCFLSFGSYYVYDNPAALQNTIMNVRTG